MQKATALHLAAEYNSHNTMQAILIGAVSAGARIIDMNISDVKEQTAWHIATVKGVSEKQERSKKKKKKRREGKAKKEKGDEKEKKERRRTRKEEGKQEKKI